MSEFTRDKACENDAKYYAEYITYITYAGKCEYCDSPAERRVVIVVPKLIHHDRYTRDLCRKHAQVWCDAGNAHDRAQYGPQDPKRLRLDF